MLQQIGQKMQSTTLSLLYTYLVNPYKPILYLFIFVHFIILNINILNSNNFKMLRGCLLSEAHDNGRRNHLMLSVRKVLPNALYNHAK